ncbi:MAG: NAD(P)H-dependent oxidoreductase [Actinomycetota bacterium]
MTTILRLDAGADRAGSVTRGLADDVVERLSAGGDAEVVARDLTTSGLPFVDDGWVGAAFAGGDGAALATSDELVDELRAADVLVISAPIYNFGVPASLKAWIDQVSRAGRTFNYTENGPVGLLEDTSAIIVTASGGTEIDGPADFAVPYLRFVLGFLGIDDIEVVAASQQNVRGSAAVDDARARLDQLLPVAA